MTRQKNLLRCTVFSIPTKQSAAQAPLLNVCRMCEIFPHVNSGLSLSVRERWICSPQRAASTNACMSLFSKVHGTRSCQRPRVCQANMHMAGVPVLQAFSYPVSITDASAGSRCPVMVVQAPRQSGKLPPQFHSMHGYIWNGYA